MARDCSYYFLFFFMEKYDKKNQITILDNCSSQTKVNLEAVNASNNL